MTKRDYFNPSDFQIYLNDENWLKLINKKVDICTTTKHRKNNLVNDKSNFMHFLINNNIFMYDIDFKKHTLEPLDKLGYKFSAYDLGFVYSFENVQAPNFSKFWVDVFEFYRSKGVDLKKSEILSAFKTMKHNPELFEYIDKNILPIQIDNIMNTLFNLSKEDLEVEWETFKHFGLGSSDMKKEFKERSDQYEKSTKKVLGFIEKSTPKQLHKMLDKISSPIFKKVTAYIAINEIPVSFLSKLDYVKLTTPKPRQWYNKYQLEIMDVIENKINIIVLEKDRLDAKAKFEEIKDKFQTNISLPFGYQDASMYNAAMRHDKNFKQKIKKKM